MPVLPLTQNGEMRRSEAEGSRADRRSSARAATPRSGRKEPRWDGLHTKQAMTAPLPAWSFCQSGFDILQKPCKDLGYTFHVWLTELKKALIYSAKTKSHVDIRVQFSLPLLSVLRVSIGHPPNSLSCREERLFRNPRDSDRQCPC